MACIIISNFSLIVEHNAHRTHGLKSLLILGNCPPLATIRYINISPKKDRQEIKIEFPFSNDT